MYINVMKLFINKLRGQPVAKDLFEYDSEEKVNANIAKSSCSCINSCNINDLLCRNCS